MDQPSRLSPHDPVKTALRPVEAWWCRPPGLQRRAEPAPDVWPFSRAPKTGRPEARLSRTPQAPHPVGRASSLSKVQKGRVSQALLQALDPDRHSRKDRSEHLRCCGFRAAGRRPALPNASASRAKFSGFASDPGRILHSRNGRSEFTANRSRAGMTRLRGIVTDDSLRRQPVALLACRVERNSTNPLL